MHTTCRSRRSLLLAFALALVGGGLSPHPATAATSDPPGGCALSGGFLSEGSTDWGNFPRPTGKVKAAMLFVDFPSAPANTTVNEEYGRFAPSSQDWYATSSYGKYSLEIVPYRRWIRLSGYVDEYAREDQAMREGGPPMVVRGNPRLASIASDAVRAAEPNFDFSKIDLLFIVPSRGSNYTRSYTDFDPIHASGRTILTQSVLAADRFSWGTKLLNHEGGHQISLPDLYGGPGGHGYVGGWDLMGLISGPAPDYFAWEKWKLGWLTDSSIACVAHKGAMEQRLSPMEDASAGTKAVVVRYGTNSVYVAEVRQKLGVDNRICATGVLIYRVNSATSSGSGPVRVMDAHPNTTVCGHPLNDAPYGVGPGAVSTFTDNAAKVRIQVLSATGNDYTIRASLG